MWFCHFFSNTGYCSKNKPKLHVRTSKNRKVRYYYRFRSWTFSSFNWIHDAFYKNNIKIVPVGIKHYLSFLALAVWIMDHGTKMQYALKIATNCFSLSDVQFLCDILLEKYNIIVTPNKAGNQYVVYIHSKSMPIVGSVIYDFVVLSMRYKIREN